MPTSEFSFVNDGLGEVLKQNLLQVPPNQRPYAWKIEHVTELFGDLKEAIAEGDDLYFMGTIVLVEGDSRKLIADGQQRIATTSIILARCRDLLRSYGESDDAVSVESEFLRKYVRRTKEHEFVLGMNIEDDEYYRKIIIEPDWMRNKPKAKSHPYPSNERMFAASEYAIQYLRDEVKHLTSKQAVDHLNTWVLFLEKRASVVAITVPDEVGAFRMFETLNDRGLRASQADILKNYFFSKVQQSDLDRVQAQWNQMYGALVDRLEHPDEEMIKYIKYFWTLQHGLTRDREIASKIKKQVRNARTASTFVSEANAAVSDYVAIFNSRDSKWSAYGQETRENLRILTEIIEIEQIVPLVFAVSHKFSVTEARKAFKLFVSWSVRFMLGGSGRAGRLDKQYADMANAVGVGSISSARELRSHLEDKVPTDDAFQRAVREAKVSNPVLSRYYLLCLEKLGSGGSGELEPSENVNEVNLEHIIPKTFTSELGVTRADHQDLLNRLGNQTIMKAEWNRDLGNLSFSKKVDTYRKSSITLTNSLVNRKCFTREEIDDRQLEMSRLAPLIWTLKFDG